MRPSVSRIAERTMLDVEDLRTFIEVVDAGGLTPAAHRLGLSKSIVSRRLARLESELGAQLLVRTTRGIVPPRSMRRVKPSRPKATCAADRGFQHRSRSA